MNKIEYKGLTIEYYIESADPSVGVMHPTAYPEHAYVSDWEEFSDCYGDQVFPNTKTIEQVIETILAREAPQIEEFIWDDINDRMCDGPEPEDYEEW
jgi:hypothetical protein